MRLRPLIVTTIIANTLLSPAYAVRLVDLSFSGSFDSGTTNDGPYGGQVFSGDVIYDLDAPVTQTSTGNFYAQFSPPLSFTYTIGGVFYSLDQKGAYNVFYMKSLFGSGSSGFSAQITGYNIRTTSGLKTLQPSDLVQLSPTSDIPYLVFSAGTGGSSSYKTLSGYSFSPVGATVPEPASWVMMISGFGIIGGSARNRKRIPLGL